MVLAAWALLVVAYTFAAGFSLPPREGTADPDGQGPTSATQLERLLSASTDGVDRLSLTPATSVHGPAELTVMVAPERSPYPTEGNALDRYMNDGGTLVLFAANSAWNEFLVDYRLRLDGSTLLPTANRTTSNILTLDLPAGLGSGQMLLPNATAVESSAPEVTTFQPDEETVLDQNADGQIEVPPDEAGAFPVAAATDVGEGRLVVIASSEAVLGNGIERNLDASGSLFQTLSQGEPSALDAATHPRGWKDVPRAPAAATLSIAQASPYAAGLLALLGIGVVYAMPQRPRTQAAEDTLDDYTDYTREVMLDRSD